jgi:hypothetical protein
MRILGYRTSNDEAITISDSDWRQHGYFIGASGSGKTTAFESLMAQDIAAELRGGGDDASARTSLCADDARRPADPDAADSSYCFVREAVPLLMCP